jgi:hypothetical protein
VIKNYHAVLFRGKELKIRKGLKVGLLRCFTLTITKISEDSVDYFQEYDDGKTRMVDGWSLESMRDWLQVNEQCEAVTVLCGGSPNGFIKALLKFKQLS